MLAILLKVWFVTEIRAQALCHNHRMTGHEISR
jgi:hypothetical protein